MTESWKIKLLKPNLHAYKPLAKTNAVGGEQDEIPEPDESEHLVVKQVSRQDTLNRVAMRFQWITNLYNKDDLNQLIAFF